MWAFNADGNRINLLNDRPSPSPAPGQSNNDDDDFRFTAWRAPATPCVGMRSSSPHPVQEAGPWTPRTFMEEDDDEDDEDDYVPPRPVRPLSLDSAVQYVPPLSPLLQPSTVDDREMRRTSYPGAVPTLTSYLNMAAREGLINGTSDRTSSDPTGNGDEDDECNREKDVRYATNAAMQQPHMSAIQPAPMSPLLNHLDAMLLLSSPHLRATDDPATAINQYQLPSPLGSRSSGPTSPVSPDHDDAVAWMDDGQPWGALFDQAGQDTVVVNPRRGTWPAAEPAMSEWLAPPSPPLGDASVQPRPRSSTASSSVSPSPMWPSSSGSSSASSARARAPSSSPVRNARGRPASNRRGSSSGPLARHTPTVVAKRKYTCTHPNCGRSFTSSGHLHRHERSVHGTEKPYACMFPGCPSKFARTDNRAQHYQTHFSGRRNGAHALKAASDSKRDPRPPTASGPAVGDQSPAMSSA
ncbi:hypothetical protein AMAG_15088 [Allomyces macrogynus ATCC 38327]|uniref:C2H2-type domain-containing protein n=1 Tax=Allomyces macrogynus (strain ATCC 38327) TaxID=578462 RepID=A0A0L0T5T7_ALLM3|nr:hypothetical protein AMAG_15088 [Allomyces macrogynus ATCC 38327]|eukprot:KNE70112.1 hypothetical protein AMAG_15088 [Allomyces macrogynus ATCC 38327]